MFENSYITKNYFDFGKIALLFTTFVLLTSFSSAEQFNVTEGEEFNLYDTNASLKWAYNQSFDTSSIQIFNETLSIGGENISVYTDEGSGVNATVYEYNLTDISNEETMIKLQSNTSGESINTSFNFTGLPQIEFGSYQVQKNNSLINEYESENINWDLKGGLYNTSVIYMNDTSSPDLTLSIDPDEVEQNDFVDIDCSASDSSNIASESLQIEGPTETFEASCGSRFESTYNDGEYTVKYSATDDAGNEGQITKEFTVSSDYGGGGSVETTPSSTTSWKGGDRSEFTAEPDEDTGVSQVSVETNAEMEDFEITVEKVEDAEGIEEPENTYNLVEITASTEEDEVEESRIQFSVNQSFASNNEVVLSRYHEGDWIDLETNPINTKGETWKYESITSGYSYFAVRAQNTEETTEEEKSQNNSEQDTRPSKEEIPEAENQSNKGQSINNTQEKSQEKDLVAPNIDIIVIGAILIALIGAMVYKIKKRTE